MTQERRSQTHIYGWVCGQGNMNRSYSWGLKGKEINIDLPVWDPTLHCCVALSEFEVWRITYP